MVNEQRDIKTKVLLPSIVHFQTSRSYKIYGLRVVYFSLRREKKTKLDWVSRSPSEGSTMVDFS